MIEENQKEIYSQQIYKNIIDRIESKRERRLSGKYNSIISPFNNFNKRFPGLEKGKYYIFTASSGIGKTKFSKFFFVNSVYTFCKENNIPLGIKYFALEETSDNFWLSMMAFKISQKYNAKITTNNFDSLGEYTLDLELLNKLKDKETSQEIIEMMQFIEVIDDVSNPYGIFKNVRTTLEEEGTYEKIGFKNTYIPKDKEKYWLVITDHISLLTPERDNETGEKMTKWDSINKFSQEYCLKGFCKRWNCITVNIQQQEASKEKQQYTFKGEIVESKLEPSLDGLADNKLTQRDADMVLGLFAPDRYKIESYRGYDITKLKDNYRSLIVLKDRHYGLANGYVHLLMDGAVNNFYQLPDKTNMTDKDYKDIVQKYQQ